MLERAPRDWRRLVRRNLPHLPVSAEREAEITEELAQLLRDASEDAGIDPYDERAVRAWLRSAIPRWRELAGTIADQERSLVRRDAPLSLAPPKRRQLMVGLRNDVRYALRMLRRSPVLAAVVVLTLALGIGLNSAVFSLINAVVLKPLPVRDEGALVRIFSQVPDGFLSHEPFAYPDYVDLLAQADGLEEVAGYAMMFAAIDSDGLSEMGAGEMVTGSYFSTLGVRPALGRLLDEGDDRREDPQPVVVLSHRTWQRRFGGERSVVGREIVVNGQSMTVVGVAPKAFAGLFRGLTPDLWMPITTAIEIGAAPMQNTGTSDPELSRLDNRKQRWLWVAGRRASGVDFDQAVAEIATVGRRLEQQYPDSNEDRALTALPLRQVKLLPGIDTGLYTASGILMSVVGLVLLIASLNLANLLLGRAVSRRREMATRLSLGAARHRIVRQLLIESLLLAGFGAVAGLLVAWISNRGLSRLEVPFTVPITVDVGLDARVVTFTLLLATVTALVFGLAPALEALRTDLSTVMRDDSARGGGSVWRRRFQGALVVAQVTFSLLLLVFAGLSLRSLLNASSIDPGFDARGAVAATLTPGFQGYEDDEVTGFFQRLREELSAEPGVESFSLPSHLPLMLWINTWDLIPEGREDLPQEEWFEVDTASVDSEYFAVMRIPLVAGRSFLEEEGREARRVVVVNDTLAQRFWPGERALGRRIRAGLEGDPYEVVGVAADGKYRTLGEDQRPFAYTPITPDWSARTAVVRFARPESASPAVVARIVREIDEHLAISNLGTVSEVIAPSLLLPRVGAVLFGLLGALGLTLAAIGLYGVLAYYVGQRRHEIGLRVAVGAGRWDIVRLVIRQGLVLTALGTVLGIVLSLIGSRALVQVLYGIGPHDLMTFSGVVAFLLLVALAACYLPARRATRVDPIEALRYE